MKPARVYLGRDSTRMAANLIAFCGSGLGCKRIAVFMIKRLSFRVTPKTAPQLAFWCGVLARSEMKLAPGESARLIGEMTEAQCAELQKWSRRALPPISAQAAHDMEQH